MGFLTVEDINSVVAEYYNQPFWDTVEIGLGDDTSDFTDVYFDYCKVSRTYLSGQGQYSFIITVENELYYGYASNNKAYGHPCYFINGNGGGQGPVFLNNPTRGINVHSPTPNITSYFMLNYDNTTQERKIGSYGVAQVADYSPKQIIKGQTEFNVIIKGNKITNFNDALLINSEATPVRIDDHTFELGFESIDWSNTNVDTLFMSLNAGDVSNNNYTTYKLPIQVIKRINVVNIPSGALKVGRKNTITLISQSNNLAVDCEYPTTVNGTNVTIDLTEKHDTKPFKMTVKTVEDSTYYPNETTFKMECDYVTINDLTGLTSLFSNGGIGRLGANITLTSDLTVSKDVLILGNDKTLTMASHKIIVPSDKIFKAEDTIFTGGKNSIQQSTGTKVELTNCAFSNCTGLGSVIDCQVDIGSLENETDFTTILTDCTISNCDMAILHGGDLTVENCNVTGKISDSKYPYFLYQTDGNARITQTHFAITNDTQIATDIKFNSCIFICGTEATINGLGHFELQNNNINSFLSTPQYNTSTVDLEYYYDLIEDYITLTATNGYCHSTSGTDYVFKTAVEARRA